MVFRDFLVREKTTEDPQTPACYSGYLMSYPGKDSDGKSISEQNEADRVRPCHSQWWRCIELLGHAACVDWLGDDEYAEKCYRHYEDNNGTFPGFVVKWLDDFARVPCAGQRWRETGAYFVNFSLTLVRIHWICRSGSTTCSGPMCRANVVWEEVEGGRCIFHCLRRFVVRRQSSGRPNAVFLYEHASAVRTSSVFL